MSADHSMIVTVPLWVALPLALISMSLLQIPPSGDAVGSRISAEKSPVGVLLVR